MLDASNPEPTKKAKSKPQNRPLQRFWPESIANIQPQLPSGLQSSSVKAEGSTSVTDTVQTQPIVIPIVTSKCRVHALLLEHRRVHSNNSRAETMILALSECNIV